MPRIREAVRRGGAGERSHQGAVVEPAPAERVPPLSGEGAHHGGECGSRLRTVFPSRAFLSAKFDFLLVPCDVRRSSPPQIAGDQDPYAPVQTQAELFTRLGRGVDRVWSIIANADHAVHLRDERRRFVENVINFLDTRS